MKIYLSFFFIICLLSLGGLFLILTKLSPESFPLLAPTLFYTLFFLASFSFFTLLGYFIRRISQSKINKYIHFHLSFRQGLLLGAFASISAYLLHIDIFTWWLETLIFFSILSIETFFMIREDI